MSFCPRFFTADKKKSEKISHFDNIELEKTNSNVKLLFLFYYVIFELLTKKVEKRARQHRYQN